MSDSTPATTTVEVQLPKGLVGFLVNTVRYIVENGLKAQVSALISDSRGRARLLAVLLPLVQAVARRLAWRQGYDQVHTQAALAGLTELALRELGSEDWVREHADELGERGTLALKFRQWYGGQAALVIVIEGLLERVEFHPDYPIGAVVMAQLNGALAGLATAFADGDRITQLASLQTGEGATAH